MGKERPEAPLAHLGELLRTDRSLEIPGLPPFTGGAVGFWGYDVVRTIESLPHAPTDDRQLPDAVVMVVDTLLVLDNLFHRATVLANVTVSPDLDAAELERRIAAAEAQMADWLKRLAAPNDARPAGDRCRVGACPGDLAVCRRRIPCRRRSLQGVHRRGRCLPDRPVAPSRRAARARSVPHLSLVARAQSGAVLLLPPAGRPHHRGRLAGSAGAGWPRRSHPATDCRDPAARRHPRRRCRVGGRPCAPIPRRLPST